MASNRAERIAGTLKKKLAEIIQRELKDPRVGFVTITDIQVSKDLRHVKAYFSVLGDEKQKKSAIIGLKRAAGFIRRRVAEDIAFRCVPEIVFKFDETNEYGQRVNELLERIRREDEQRSDRGGKGIKEA